MNENHFSYFKVENFKRFESFEMDNIGQFNLIVGDNNVGKTSVLEALCFNKDIYKYMHYLKYIILKFKHFSVHNHPIFEFVNKNIPEENLISPPQINFSLKYKEHKSEEVEKYTIVFNPGNVKLYLNGQNASNNQFNFNLLPNNPQFNDAYDKPPLIPLYLGYTENLSELYSTFIQKKVPLRKKLIQSLSVLIPELVDFDIDTQNQNAILLRIANKDILMPLATFGDGAIKLFRILLEIVMNEGKRIMIDEIDSGIHHKRLLPVWKTIVKSALNNNVQIFATTHSNECLKFFRDVFLEDDMKGLQEKARVFRLVEHKDKQVSAYCYDFEAFDHAIENENELR